MTLTIFKPAHWMEIQSLIHRRTLICEENNEIKWITRLWRLTEGLAFVVSQASFMLSLLFSFYSLEKSRWMPYIGPCACWLWHGTWTCFLTRSKDRGTMRETCSHASATAWEGFGAYLWQLAHSFQFLIIISKSKAILQLLMLCSKNKENWRCPLEPPGKR